MSFEFIKKLPTPDQIREEYPVPDGMQALKNARDQEIREVFTGQSDKFLVIIGPCSADNEDAVCEYVSRLAKVNEKVNDKLILIPRIYTNKPRTTGDGYKGIVHQPDPEKGTDFLKGIMPCERCSCGLCVNQGLLQQMRCSTLRTGAMSQTFSLMWQSAPALLRISSTGLL